LVLLITQSDYFKIQICKYCQIFFCQKVGSGSGKMTPITPASYYLVPGDFVEQFLELLGGEVGCAAAPPSVLQQGLQVIHIREEVLQNLNSTIVLKTVL
jgi:hypothetical protein